MGRPPVLDYNRKLTAEQHDLVFGTIMTDAWIELQKGARHARYGIQLTGKNPSFVENIYKGLDGFVKEPPKSVLKSPPRSTQKFEQLLIRTPAHPEFTEYRRIFYPQGKKRVPAVSYLLPRVTYQSLAYMLSCDGSVKSAQNKSMEIHLQSFSEQSVGRLCMALREKLQIKCKPSKEKKRGSEKEYQWVLYISGESHDILYDKVRPLMVDSMQYKVPTGRVRSYKSITSACDNWYFSNSNLIFREDISSDFKSSQVKSSQVKSSQVKSSQVM